MFATRFFLFPVDRVWFPGGQGKYPFKENNKDFHGKE
jgi:hypothetical protein